MKTANPNDNTNRNVVHLNFGFCATRTNRNGCLLKNILYATECWGSLDERVTPRGGAATTAACVAPLLPRPQV